MESKEKYIEFISGSQYTKLKWTIRDTSEEMVIDAIDNLGKIFLSYFNSTFLNFLNQQGSIVSIYSIVEENISPVYVRGPDGDRNQLMPFAINNPRRPSIVSENFKERRVFWIKGCKLVEEKHEDEVTMDEVAKHSKKSDCWTVINGKVYNITAYVKSHPGGNAILRAAGKDGTQLFNQTHPWVSEAVYQQFCIGVLGKEVKKK